jgi:allantoinase
MAAENPARHFGLFPNKGQIAEGADADIAVLAREPRPFNAGDMTSEVKWSPFSGMSMAGTVVATYVRGQPVYEEGGIVAAPGYGRFIKPVAGAA